MSVKKFKASDQQIEMWDHAQKVSSPFWNFLMYKAIEGSIKINFFKLALYAVMKRHSGIRTKFYKDNGILFQIIEDKIDIDSIVSIKNLDGLSDSIFFEYTKAYTRKLLKYPFDYRKDIMIKVSLVYKRELTYIIVLVNHIVCDFSSMQIFWKELFVYYNSYFFDRHNTLNLKEARQYYQYSLNQEVRKGTERYSEQVKYWEQKLKNITGKFKWPFNGSSKAISYGYGEITLQNSVMSSLRTTSLKYRVLFSSIFQLAYYLLIFFYSRHPQIFFLNIFNCRGPSSQLHTETFGLFADTVLNTINIDSNEKLSSLLKRVDKENLSAINNSQISFREVFPSYQKQLHNENYNFQADFNFIKTKKGTDFLGDTKLTNVNKDAISTKFVANFNVEQCSYIDATSSLEISSDLSLTIREEGTEATIKLALLSGNKDTCLELTRNYHTILKQINFNSDTRIHMLFENLSFKNLGPKTI